MRMVSIFSLVCYLQFLVCQSGTVCRWLANSVGAYIFSPVSTGLASGSTDIDVQYKCLWDDSLLGYQPLSYKALIVT